MTHNRDDILVPRMTVSPKPATLAPTSFRNDTADDSKNPSAGSAGSSAAVALSMSWQLLVVLVVPIVGGHLLDVHYGTAHIWTVLGMALAVLASIMVVRQAVAQLNDIMRRDTRKGRS